MYDSRTLHKAVTLWITYYSTFPAWSRGGALVGSLGDKVPQLKVVTSKFYAFFVVIHTQYMKSKRWLLKTKTTKHNSNPQMVHQYELLSSSVWKKWVKHMGTPNVHVSHRLFTKGRGWVYERPISEKAEVFLFWICARKTF